MSLGMMTCLPTPTEYWAEAEPAAWGANCSQQRGFMQACSSSCGDGDGMQDACRGGGRTVQRDRGSGLQGFSCGALRGKGAEMKGSTAPTSEVHEWRGPTGTDATL